MTNAIIISQNPHALFPVEFGNYLTNHFADWQVERRSYYHPEGAGKGNLVFAEEFSPIGDYEVFLQVIKAEGNRVFILSRGLDNRRNTRDYVRGGGIDGIIYKDDRDFKGFSWQGGINRAAKLLSDLVL